MAGANSYSARIDERERSRQQQQGKDCILIMGLAAGAVQRGSGAGDRIINDKGSSNIHIDQVHHR